MAAANSGCSIRAYSRSRSRRPTDSRAPTDPANRFRWRSPITRHCPSTRSSRTNKRWYGKRMTAVLTAIEENLETDYSPDREFVAGLVVERHLGEQPHSIVQSNVHYSLRRRYPKLLVLPEQRVRTTPNRCRVPDI